MEGITHSGSELLNNAERKRFLTSEFGALRRDWFAKKGIEIEGKSYSELKEAVGLFYSENADLIREALESDGDDVEVEISAIAKRELDVVKVHQIREKIGLPKWVSLAETVAFIKTAMDLSDEEIRERYVEYCASGISLDDMRNTLAFENDVKPARLDTDIYHQSPSRTRSVVEIVSNAIDAMSPEENTIGRFGVGFYQVLSHLKSEDDVVTVKTGTEKDGFYKIEFKLFKGEIKINLQEINDLDYSGTTVELQTKDFPRQEAEQMVSKHLAFNTVARVFCNGKEVNNLASFGVDILDEAVVDVQISENGYSVKDTGKGMSPQVILEKLLVPKLSGKKSVDQIEKKDISAGYIHEARSEGDTSPGKAVINVGGVVIEEIEVTGLNTVKTLVINLPPYAFLSEERNRVAVDKVTIEALKKLIDEMVDGKDIALLNSLVHITNSFQKRSQIHSRTDDLTAYLRDAAEKRLPSDKKYVPNSHGFERLKIDGAILIDPDIRITNWGSIDEIKSIKTTGNGVNIYVAPVEPVIDEPAIIYRKRIIIDENIYKKFKDDPTVLNLFLEAYGKAESSVMRSVVADTGKGEIKNESFEIIQYADLVDYFKRNYESLGFINEGAALDFYDHELDERLRKLGNMVVKNILNKFPQDFSKYFMSRIIDSRDFKIHESFLQNINEENLVKFGQLANDTELVQLLIQLDILPYNLDEKPLKVFKGIKDYKYRDQADRAIELDKGAVGNLDLKLYQIKYFDRDNIVFEDGEVFAAKNPVYIEELNRIYLGPDEDGSKLRFLDPATKEITYLQINSKDKLFKRLDKSTQFGVERPIFKNVNGENVLIFYYDYAGTPDDCFILPVNLNTGEVFSPRPDLGEIVRFIESDEQVNGETALFVLQKKSGKGVTEHALFLDGSVRQITELERSTNASSSDYGFKQVFENNFYKFKATYGDTFTLNIDEKNIFEVDMEETVKNASKNGFRWAREGNVIDLQRFLMDDKQYALVQIRCGKSILFNENGDKMFELSDKEQLLSICKTTDGRDAYIVGSKKSIGYKRGGNDNDDVEVYSVGQKRVDVNLDNLSGYEIFDFNKNKLGLNDLLVVDNIFYRNNLDSLGIDYYKLRGESKFSVVTGENWKYEFKEEEITTLWDYRLPSEPSKPKVETAVQKVVTIHSNTSEQIVPVSFRSVSYVPEKKLWECTLANDFVKDGIAIETEYFIDSSGKVVEIREVGEQKRSHDTIVEYDKVVDAPIIDIKQEFTESKLAVIKNALSKKVFEGEIEVGPVLSRLYKYNHLSDENFERIVDVLLTVEHLDERLTSDNIIANISTQLEDVNDSSRMFFFKFANRLIPPSLNEEDIKRYTDKLISVYKSKVMNLPVEKRDEVYETLSTTRDYDGKFLVNGFNIIRHKTPIPSHLIPENIRAIVDFLRVEESEVNNTDTEPLSVNSAESFKLSQLIQTKRLNENRVIGISGADELKSLVKEKTLDKTQDHIQREIIHPIYYQTVDNNYLFIRELVQNSHDAVIQSTGNVIDRDIDIDIFSRKEKEITLRIKDPVGMSSRELINYFLIPGETTKLNSEEAIGYFGQGLFTLFRGAKEVVLQTSKGGGQISKMRLTPNHNEKGVIVDLNIQIEEEAGEFKGTIIERTMDTDFPAVEAAYVKNAVSTFASLVDGNVVNVKLNDVQINKSLHRLASTEVEGMGTITIYDAPNNVATQRGLYIKPLDKDFDTGIKDVEDLLHKKGYVLNIPDSVDLTRSRNEIARKEEVLDKMMGKIVTTKIRAYLEVFKQDIVKGHVIQLDNLPYDYFYWPYMIEGRIIDDAKKLQMGESIDDVERYKDKGSLISLLVHLPAVEIDGKTWSIYELKNAANNEEPPLEKKEKFDELPESLRSKLLEGKERSEQRENSREREESEKVKDFPFSEWQKQNPEVVGQISGKLDAYKNMMEMADKLNKDICETIGPEQRVQTTLYKESGSKAHATQGFGIIGWNLDYWNGYVMKPFEKKNPSDKDLSNFLSVWSHEWGHIFEKSQFTHNLDFYKKQSQTLARLMSIR